MNAQLPKGGLSLVGSAVTLKREILMIQAPVSYTNQPKPVKNDNRVYFLRGVSSHQIDEWFNVVSRVIKDLTPDQKLKMMAMPPPIPSRLSRHLTVSKKFSPAFLREYDQFSKIVEDTGPAAKKLNEEFIFSVRKENMEGVVRELRTVIAHPSHPIHLWLKAYSEKQKEALSLVTGTFSRTGGEAQFEHLRKFASDVKTVCVSLADFIPKYFEEDRVFFDFYPLEEISVLVREMLLSHFGLFDPIYDCYLLFYTEKDCIVFEKLLRHQHFNVIDLAVRNKHLWLGEDVYRPAIQTIAQISKSRSVSIYYECLTGAALKLVECLTAYWKTYLTLGGDEILPLYQWLLLKARPGHLYTCLNIMTDFGFEDSELQGVYGYYVTTFASAVMLLNDIDKKKLDDEPAAQVAVPVSRDSQAERLTLGNRPPPPTPGQGVSSSPRTSPRTSPRKSDNGAGGGGESPRLPLRADASPRVSRASDVAPAISASPSSPAPVVPSSPSLSARSPRPAEAAAVPIPQSPSLSSQRSPVPGGEQSPSLGSRSPRPSRAAVQPPQSLPQSRQQMQVETQQPQPGDEVTNMQKVQQQKQDEEDDEEEEDDDDSNKK